MFIFKISPKRILLYSIDISISLLALYFAYLLRWDGSLSVYQTGILLNLLPFVFICYSFSFLYFKFYSRFWEYSSLEDLILIIKSVTAGSVLIIFTTFIYNRSFMIPRSIIIIDSFGNADYTSNRACTYTYITCNGNIQVSYAAAARRSVISGHSKRQTLYNACVYHMQY